MDSVYKVIEIIGSSPKSWEEATENALKTASKTLKEIRVAEVKDLDVRLEDGKIAAYRAKLRVSFKFSE